MTHQLKDNHKEQIINILAANPRVERAILFGSRAMETNTVTSDVDIALFGEDLTLTDLARLSDELDQLSVPQRVDLLIFHRIENENLIEHIQQHGEIWFLRNHHTSLNLPS
jgi:predicted nucleotidyltransferase